MLLIMFCEGRVVRTSLGKRTLALVKFGKLCRHFDRVGLDTRDLVINGDCLLSKALLVVILGHLHITVDRIPLLRIFGVQIAKHIQRRDITRIVVNHRLILGDRRADLTLRYEPLRISHRFSFIETHVMKEVKPGLGGVCQGTP